MATKKSQSSASGVKYLIGILLLALGIYLVVTGVLSDMSNTWRSVLIAAGMAFAAGSTITITMNKS